MINVCVPVLNRYDLLRELLLSLAESDVLPSAVHIVDNGRDQGELGAAIADVERVFHIEVFVPRKAMGLAESWNWFMRNVPEQRLIVNDDITFAPESIEKILSTKGLFVSPIARTNAFSCFLISQECYDRTGEFDESISPGYAYFEDCDYAQRMDAIGIQITSVEDTGIVHTGSQTIKIFDYEKTIEHHRRFKVARANFFKKWGAMPVGWK